ncbi:hypothetical protein HYH03_001619 [Edaphochlamys debaryana]|uniref:Uncharacterized protein n=1 Tax=Edaphochlamys debaryana TaxID=47281 RepID=A0A835YGM9_9CHLO|nr:hypothetical protein HYH03_001619 [Edaphochlamys debaryana]|eukprot:KAG2500858.1 hypothetical protein HYH03_001619 [Edaphochlamys debaryana]
MQIVADHTSPCVLCRWGGYFTIPAPPRTPSLTGYTTYVPVPASSPVFGCAGCASNDPRKGYDVGSITLQVRAIDSKNFTASCIFNINNPSDRNYNVDSGHFYASFSALPTFAPGLFTPQPTTTGIPGSDGTTVTMSKPVGGTGSPGNLIYIACHFTVNRCYARR